jgi:hypothetical protein
MEDEFPHDGDCPTSYCLTPNVMVPLNSRETGSIATVAMEQLRHYQALASTWPMERHEHHSNTAKGRPCWCCVVCDPCETIWFINDRAGGIYSYSEEEILTLKVAHIRQVHDDG